MKNRVSLTPVGVGQILTERNRLYSTVGLPNWLALLSGNRSGSGGNKQQI